MAHLRTYLLLSLLLRISAQEEETWNASGLFDDNVIINNDIDRYVINNETNSSTLVTPSPAPMAPTPSPAPTAHAYSVAQEYQILFTSNDIDYSPVLVESSNSTGFDFPFKRQFEQYMSLLSVEIIDRGWVTSSVGFRDFKSDSTFLDFQISHASNETVEYALTYSMLYLSNEVDISTFPNFHVSLLEYPSQQDKLASKLNHYFNVSDVTIVGVSKFDPPSQQPSEAPTSQPTPLEPWHSAASYELRFEILSENEAPDSRFYNGTVICAILSMISNYMAESFQHDPSRIETICRAGTPEAFEVTEEFEISNRALRIIPDEDEEDAEGTLRRRRRLQAVNTTDDAGNTTEVHMYAWEVRFDIEMEWISYYENVTGYGDELSSFLRSSLSELPLGNIGEALGIEDLSHRLHKVKFSQQHGGLPTTMPTPPTTPLEPYWARGTYELRFETYVFEGEEQLQEEYYNGTVSCMILGYVSEYMSETKFSHDPSLIEYTCLPSTPETFEVTEEFDLSNPRFWIPAEQQEDSPEEEVQERPFGLRRRRRRLQAINDTQAGNETMPAVIHAWEVRYIIDMKWISYYYENVVEYPDAFGSFVRTNDLDMSEVGEALGIEDLSHRLQKVKFSQQEVGLPTKAPQKKTKAPTMAPSAAVTATRETPNTQAPSILETVPELGLTDTDEAKEEDAGEDKKSLSQAVAVIVAVVVLLVVLGGCASVVVYVKKMEAKLEEAKQEQAKLAEAMLQAQANSTIVRAPQDPTIAGENNNFAAAKPDEEKPQAALAVSSPFGTGTTQASMDDSEMMVPKNNAHHTTTPMGGSNARPAAMAGISAAQEPSDLDALSNIPLPEEEYRSPLSERGPLSESINPSDLFPSMAVLDLDDGESFQVLDRNQEQLYSSPSLPSLPEEPLTAGLPEDPLTAGLDEFEDYKDQNLEKMRETVERQVSGLGNMISQAMTMALIDQEDEAIHDYDGMSGVEIEATTLWQVTDWSRRNGNADHYETQNYMKELLNKMVKCVHQGLVAPEDASRTIHGSAALLGLALANELPSNTYILKSMLKKTTARDIVRTFDLEFGPVEDAAVAVGNKGFGIVRFKHPSAAARAMEQFQTSEIVVNDVAIQLVPLEKRLKWNHCQQRQQLDVL